MRILFMGTSPFAVPIMTHMVKSGRKIIGVVTQPDMPTGRGMVIKPSPVKEAAGQLGLPVFQPSQAKKETFIKTVEALEVDLIVLAAFGQILPKDLLDLPTHGCINVHPSLLPKYRGPAPIQWSIINGDHETGVTVLFLNERLDQGDIINQRRVDVEDEDTTETVTARLSLMGAKLLEDAISMIGEGNVTRTPQDDEGSTYAPSLSKEDGEIDWTLPAERIHNTVRGLTPWPGTFTSLHHTPLKICQTAVYSKDTGGEFRKRPGKILAMIKQEGWLVSTGEGKLVIKKVQLQGKRVMTVGEFSNGHHVEIGTVFHTPKTFEKRGD